MLTLLRKKEKALLAKAGVNAVPVLKVGDEFYVGAKAMQYIKGLK